MKAKALFIILISNIFFFTPYEEEPLCKSGKGTGYCGSVSDVYEIKIKEQKWR